ncbi:restriction endonuclease subunit S [Agrobacterium sp. RAC06]|uniref:restriction endonuclease subunit S n=1 Tax=Agrobacterium sp. RAC06 TaxID=1842536 RepID=UPI00083D61AB|nr:restriction endonuclease subunit S [Agrobacterium sp. RAC06]AOG11819.1 type I restriction modification DNA specificity domain protein [Agrobacterium sp. RAC06]
MKRGWSVRTIGDLISKGETVDPTKAPGELFSYVDVSSVSNDTFKIVQTSKLMGADAPSRARRRIRANDVIFATIRPTLKRIAVVPEYLDQQICSTGYIVLRALPDLNPRYLFHYLFSDAFQSSMEILQTGASYPAVTDGQVKQQPIPLPPLEEQQRIVAILDEAFEGLDRARVNAEANLQNARELFEMVRNEALRIGNVGSRTVRFSDVAEITAKLVDPRKDAYADLPHVGAGNMVTGSDQLIDVKTAREEQLISGKHPFDENMVLYSKIRPYLRKVARPDFGGLCSADVYPLAPKFDVLLRDYLYHLLSGNDFTRYAIAGSDRAGMPKVNRDHLFAYEFSLPRFDDQCAICRKLDDLQIATERLAEIYTGKLRELADLRQSLLRKAFAGELT